MESYVFKTSSGIIGFFQKDGDSCHLVLNNEFFPDIESFEWSTWVAFKDGPDANYAPETTLKDPLSKAISYFVWKFSSKASPNIIELIKSSFPPGEYCKRINRNSLGLYDIFRREHSVIDEVRSYNNLMSSMNDIFNVVEPDNSNLHVYGHRIREVLTIACTEVEYLLLQILKENGYHASRYRTNDYIKALPVLKLDKYSVELIMHPSMGLFSPFSGWDDNNPTKSLSWYSSYNATKHDRGTNFRHASLDAMINAVAAVHILLESQYGNRLFDKPMFSNYESSFRTKNSPTWECNEIFVPLIEENNDLLWKSNFDYFKR